MPWWLWLVLGLALLGGEMLAPGGLYLLFLGIGALIVGVMTLAGIAGRRGRSFCCSRFSRC